MLDLETPKFWRDDALPFIEGRLVADGRKVRYDKHSHREFSMGVITDGTCIYLNGKENYQVRAGSTVIMNPNEVHSCNPVDHQKWSYRMIYVDLAWLVELQMMFGLTQNNIFKVFPNHVSQDAEVYFGFGQMFDELTNQSNSATYKHGVVVDFFEMLHQRLNAVSSDTPLSLNHHLKLRRAAEYMDENYTQSLSLQDVCIASELSESHLIRTFTACYGMTPHNYLNNRRIQFAQNQLKQGHSIAGVALEAGFADQAHFQRVFKRFVAATPRQYRS